MKIAFITDFAPTIENYRGPSALCFYLLKELCLKHDVMVVTQNINKVPKDVIASAEKKMQLKCIVNSRSFWQKCIISSRIGRFFFFIDGNRMPFDSRFRLNRQVRKEIKRFAPDVVWVYPHYLYKVMAQLQEFPVYAIGPDCSTLGSLRFLEDSFVHQNNLMAKAMRNLNKQIRLECEVAKWAKKILLVGLEDQRVFNNVTNSDKAVFMPHPHYACKGKEISFAGKKISVLFSGAFDQYTSTDFLVMRDVLGKRCADLKKFKFTFVGKNWKEVLGPLEKVLDVDVKEWVDCYTDELIVHDVQIFPISMGVGTKGKVLDALANGVLCIGSYYALENIAVENNKSCLRYSCPEDIVELLLRIQDNPSFYEQIAEMGRRRVLEKHSPVIGAAVIESVCQNEDVIVSRDYFTR